MHTEKIPIYYTNQTLLLFIMLSSIFYMKSELKSIDYLQPEDSIYNYAHFYAIHVQRIIANFRIAHFHLN